MPFCFDSTRTGFIDVNTASGLDSTLVDIDGKGQTPGAAYVAGPLHAGNPVGYNPTNPTEFGTVSIDQTVNPFMIPLPFYGLFVKTFARIKSFLKVDKLLTVELIKSKIIYTEVLMAKSKNFVIDHPTKENKRLVHACLEGPENGVYIRGRIKDDGKILLPDYWTNLIDYDTITVSLTPIGSHQDLIVKEISEDYIQIQSNYSMPIDCFYHIFAERKDITKLETEIDK
jgi:hypothetical protein